MYCVRFPALLVTVIFTAASLFVRGGDSVRIVRTIVGGTTFQLAIEGPQREHQTREYLDPLTCARAQWALEQQLLSEGFRAQSITERRSGKDQTQKHAGERRRRL